MRFQYLAAAVMAAAVSAQTTAITDCPQTCLNAYNTCRGAPDSNKSFCASQYATCLGYSPFGSDGSLITPTACSVASTSAPSATPTANACASACLSAYNTCRGAPDSNKATCAAQYAGCLGYSPFGSDGSLITPTACSVSSTSAPSVTPTANACAAACLTTYNTCRGAPDSNKSYCASQYAGCLGYSPFGADGSLITPTACSATSSKAPTSTAVPMTTSTVYATKVYTVTSCAPTVTNCPAMIGKVTTETTILYTTVCPVSQVTSAPTTMTTSASTPPSCPAACMSAYNTCRVAPDSNKSFCAAQYAACLGYSPFGADGSLIIPTACSSSATVSATSYGTVSMKPTTTTGLPQFTGAADSTKPFMGLLALGALALL